MIYTYVGNWDFHNAFRGRSDVNNFSYEALDELFEYYESLSDETGEDVELDPVAINCEWTEYTPEELFDAFAADDPDDHDLEALTDDEIIELKDELLEALVDDLKNQTLIIEVSNGNYLVLDF